MNNPQQTDTLKINLSIIITKSAVTNNYIALQPMNYDFYLLYLLCIESLFSREATTDTDHFKKNDGIDFCKNSSMKCLVTSHLFIHKNNGYIELFSIYDLANTDDLCLPKSPKFIMTAKNFMNFMTAKSKIMAQQPDQFFIVIDSNGHAHLTTDLQSLEKKSFFIFWQKKLANLFTRSTK